MLLVAFEKGTLGQLRNIDNNRIIVAKLREITLF